MDINIDSVMKLIIANLGVFLFLLIILVILIVIIIKQKNKIKELDDSGKKLSSELNKTESKKLMEKALFLKQRKQLQESILKPVNIGYFRKRLGISKEQLADMVGETKNTIKALEKGAYNPTLKLAKKITKALRRDNVEDVFEVKE